MFSNTYSIIQFIIGLIGAFITIGCFLPQGIKTCLSRDTTALSKWFFILSLICSLFWITIGSMTIASPYVLKNGDTSSALASGLPPIITNVITLFINAIILIIKIKNRINAKKHNISEAEYCNLIRKEIASKL